MRTAWKIVPAGLLVGVSWIALVQGDDSPNADQASLAEILVLESLRTHLGQVGNLAYSEYSDFSATRRRFDWVISSFPEGDWSCLAHLPTHDGSTDRRLYIRRGSEVLVGVLRRDLSWTATIDDYSPGHFYRHSPTASWWFPVDSIRVDERIGQWDALDAQIGGGTIALTFPANTAVSEALEDAGAQIYGLFAYRFEYTLVGGNYVLSRSDILLAERDKDGREVPSVDPWRGDIAGYHVRRSYSLIWSDFRYVGSYLLPMTWESRHPKGVARGGIVPGSIVHLAPEEVERRLLLRVPDDWTGAGVFSDRRTGEILLSRTASRGLTEREAPPAPTILAPPSRGPITRRARSSAVLICVGIAFGLLALLLYYRRGKSDRK